MRRRIDLVEQIGLALMEEEGGWGDPFAVCLLTFAREVGEERGATLDYRERDPEGPGMKGSYFAAAREARGELGDLAWRALERLKALGFRGEDPRGDDPDAMDAIESDPEGARGGFWLEAKARPGEREGAGWRIRAAEAVREALEAVAREEGFGGWRVDIAGWGDLEERYPDMEEADLCESAARMLSAARERERLEERAGAGLPGAGRRRL